MKRKYIEIIILLILSSLIVFFKFNEIPKNLAYDEVEFAKLALSLDKKPYAPFSLLATGHATFYFYIILASFKIFGITSFALRFPSAMFGVLCVPLFYLIMKHVFNNKENNYDNSLSSSNNKRRWLSTLPFLLTIIFLSLRWFFNFARFSFEPTLLLFLELASIFFLFKYLNNLKKIHLLVFSGAFAGLAYNSYTAGRIFFALPLLFLILKGIKKDIKVNRQTFKKIIYKIVLFIIPFIILIAPLNIYLSKVKDTRIDQLFFLRNHEMTINEKITGLGENIYKTALMFGIKGDINGRHNYPGKPALNPILAILFSIGLFLAIKNFSQFYNKFFVLYFSLSLIPALMTYSWENPNMIRTYTVIPSVVYFIGLSIKRIINIRFNKINKKYLYIFIIAIIFSSSLYEIRTYFFYQAKVFKKSFQKVGTLKDNLKSINYYEKK